VAELGLDARSRIRAYGVAMTRLFTGDYSTGDFSQWDSAISKDFEIEAKRLPQSGSYPAEIVRFPIGGYAARFEVRPGDMAIGEKGKERTEVYAHDRSLAAIGTTRWYAFSLKFDETWPDQAKLGWMVVTQWHDAIHASPTVSLGWTAGSEPGFRSGYWYLMWNPQWSPGRSVSPTGHVIPLVEMPVEPGHWQEIKMRATWSPSDTMGSLEFWHNGVQQKFLYGGKYIFRGRTCCPGSPFVYIQQGIYRQPSKATNILFHRGMRMADVEASL
jgi:hypothetical protein